MKASVDFRVVLNEQKLLDHLSWLPDTMVLPLLAEWVRLTNEDKTQKIWSLNTTILTSPQVFSKRKRKTYCEWIYYTESRGCTGTFCSPCKWKNSKRNIHESEVYKRLLLHQTISQLYCSYLLFCVKWSDTLFIPSWEFALNKLRTCSKTDYTMNESRYLHSTKRMVHPSGIKAPRNMKWEIQREQNYSSTHS